MSAADTDEMDVQAVIARMEVRRQTRQIGDDRRGAVLLLIAGSHPKY